MRSKVTKALAATAAVAALTGGTLALTESPADAAPCKLISLQLGTITYIDILNICI